MTSACQGRLQDNSFPIPGMKQKTISAPKKETLLITLLVLTCDVWNVTVPVLKGPPNSFLWVGVTFSQRKYKGKYYDKVCYCGFNPQ